MEQEGGYCGWGSEQELTSRCCLQSPACMEHFWLPDANLFDPLQNILQPSGPTIAGEWGGEGERHGKGWGEAGSFHLYNSLVLTRSFCSLPLESF